jgi:hypothetical protein
MRFDNLGLEKLEEKLDINLRRKRKFPDID